jgi:hypothetical protein
MAREETLENYDVSVVMIRDTFAAIVSVDEHITDVLGGNLSNSLGVLRPSSSTPRISPSHWTHGSR